MMKYFDVLELKDSYRLIIRGLLLLLPFVVIQFIEIVVLPIDFFTFRVWEAALSPTYRYPGAYYPNLHIKKEKEYGDHYRMGEIQSKPAEWYTDSYGWRNRPEIANRKHYDAVILGDSNIVGSFIDQKNILSEVLGRRANKTVYSYAGGCDVLGLFFSDPRSTLKTTKLVVIESKAGNWSTSNSCLRFFRQLPDGSLDLVDRREDFEKNYYASGRWPLIERTLSRLNKQPKQNARNNKNHRAHPRLKRSS